MAHPYKEPGEVIPDAEEVIFSPKLALEMMEKYQPKREKKAQKLAAREEKARIAREEREAENKRQEEERAKILKEKAKHYWHTIVEQHIKEGAQDGEFSAQIKVSHWDSDIIAAVVLIVEYGRSIGWSVFKESDKDIRVSWKPKDKQPLRWSPRWTMLIMSVALVLFAIALFVLTTNN